MQKQKMQIREEFQRAMTEKEVIRNELRDLKQNKLPRGVKMDTIESELQQLEYMMQHESMSAQDEKKMQKQLQDLNAARPIVRDYRALEEKLKVVEENRASAKARLDQCDSVLEGIKAKQDTENVALDEIRRQRDKDVETIPDKEAEKKECWEIIQVLRAKMDEIRENFNAKWNEWVELNKHYNAWRRHEQHRQ
jgi:chromosome segregation ATPase